MSFAPAVIRETAPAPAAPRRPILQRRLTVNQPGDPCECEAERISEEATRSGQRGILQARRSPSGDFGAGMAPPIVDEALGSPGKPLDPVARAFMEPRLGHDFSQVRVHTGSVAERSAKMIGAQAYTSGRQIVFGAGQYAPGTSTGRKLLAHELVHTIQQAAVSPTVQRKSKSERDPIHQPLLDDFSRAVGDDEMEQTPGLSPGKIKYGLSNEVKDLVREMLKLIDGAVWKEIRKRVYPVESASGIARAKERRESKTPDLSGLGRIKTLDRFASTVRGLQPLWPALPPAERLKKLAAAANRELKDAEVAEFLAVDSQPMESKGFFRPSAWQFVISEQLVNHSNLPDAEAAEVTNVTLHEARHAEQHFLAARFSAGETPKTAAQLATEQKIPRPVAAQALANKFDSKTDPTAAALGKRMFQAMVTDAAANQSISNNDGWEEMAEKREAARIALKSLALNPTDKNIAMAKARRDELSAQVTVVEEKYKLYRAIPYEADAHEVGDAAGEAFKRLP